ncbi:MAG: NFACT family protein [Lachnospiraceae bacterium]|nr:NFACT family protein [Lachnospiraceae bacterium]
MALDGMMVAALKEELREKLTGGRLIKIAQPEPDELLLTIKNEKQQYRLKLSANASLPYAAIVETTKQAPATAPNFCMLLRKHLQNGRIRRISQPGLERILNITIEHLNEMGDLCAKTLVTELMGKHSNIILIDEDQTILDSIKHISAMVSSVREVLPGKPYFIPETTDKHDPFGDDEEAFISLLRKKPMPLDKALYSSYTGISPTAANELIFRAGTDPDHPAADTPDAALKKLYAVFKETMEQVADGQFSLQLVYENKHPIEFSAIALTQYGDMLCKPFPTASALLSTYYSERDTYTRMRQKSSDLRHITQTCLERSIRKAELQEKQLKDTEKMEKYRIYGELIHTYGYDIAPGSKVLSAVNFYDGQTVEIPLNPSLSPADNAGKYFERYTKLKRTKEAATKQLAETKAEIEQLSSILTSLELSQDEQNLAQIKEELAASGYIRKHDPLTRRKNQAKKNAGKSLPWHYLSSDGYDIYVGKNNLQNDYLTFHMAGNNDWWFHAKKIPGSHVILKTKGQAVPDRAFEEAGALAAYYSKGQNQNKVEIDYVEKKQIKKPAGARPGFVVYYTNYSLSASPDISMLKLIED